MSVRTLLITCVAATVAFAQNDIHVGPGYQRNQSSVAPISFSLPKGWTRAQEAEEKAGLFAIIVPTGSTLESADRAITIAFQKKNPQVPELASLDAFFRADLQNTLAQFPNMQAVRWQPSGLDPDKINFRSLEMFGGGTSPHRTVFIETSDGFFSVTVTTETRRDLGAHVYDAFFSSLKLP